MNAFGLEYACRAERSPGLVSLLVAFLRATVAWGGVDWVR